MKATELRLGNWVINPFKAIIPIEEIHKSSLVCKNTAYSFTHCKTIQLTEEILLKCGGYKQNYGLEINDTTQLDFVITNDAVYPFITQNGEFSGQLPSQVNLERIQHLHELQNLFFALTGTELEINL